MNHTELLELASKVVSNELLDDCRAANAFSLAAFKFVTSPEFAALVERARCFGEIGAVMSADGGHRLDEIGPAALLAEIEAKYYALVKDAERYRWLRGAGFEFIQIGGKSLTVSTSDTGLDYAIDAAIDAELKP